MLYFYLGFLRIDRSVSCLKSTAINHYALQYTERKENLWCIIYGLTLKYTDPCHNKLNTLVLPAPTVPHARLNLTLVQRYTHSDQALCIAYVSYKDHMPQNTLDTNVFLGPRCKCVGFFQRTSNFCLEFSKCRITFCKVGFACQWMMLQPRGWFAEGAVRVQTWYLGGWRGIGEVTAADVPVTAAGSLPTLQLLPCWRGAVVLTLN